MAEAFINFNLAPLNLRRDISMLGFLHKLNLEHAHPDILELFPRGPDRRLWNRLHECRHVAYHDLMKRSVFQLVDVYNNLPRTARMLNNVSEFQRQLTQYARNLCMTDHESWDTFLAARSWGSINIGTWKMLFIST